MRMKKLMILAVAAIALVACSKTFEPSATSEGNAIGFGTWTNVLTKTNRTPGTGTFVASDDFAVSGTKSVSSSNVDVFNNVTVTYGGTDWTYPVANKQYWDNSADSYTFYAISPAELCTADDPVLAMTTAGVVTTNSGKSLTFAGNDNDILLADKVTVNKGSSAPYFLNYEKVNMQFNHAAAMLDIKVKKSSGLDNVDAKLEITGITLSDIDKTATFEVSAYSNTNYNSETNPLLYHPTLTTAWAEVTNAAKGTYTNANSVGGPATLPDDVSATGDDVITNLIVLPQTFRASNASNTQKVTITYKIYQKIGEDGSDDPIYGAASEYAPGAFALTLFDETDESTDTDNNGTVTGWEPGKHYTYIITIDARAIEFTAAVTSWGTVTNAHYYLVN